MRSKSLTFARCLLALVLSALPQAARSADPTASPALKTYDTPQYRIRTDLDETHARGVAIRMTKLADLFRAWARELSLAAPEKRLTLHLFKYPRDYYATGAPPESVGAYVGDRLLALGSDGNGGVNWHVVQHEAFHQFAAAALDENLPMWLNEGLADYFGEALFTGDGFVSGIIPDWRLRRLKRSIRTSRIGSFEDLMDVTQEAWNHRLSLDRYDHAWSVVHFLYHGDNGAHRGGLDTFLKAVADGTPAADAWSNSFPDTPALQRQWRAYWLELGDNPSARLYTESVVATLTSFLARASASGQTFDGFDQFVKMARDGRLRCAKEDRLPRSLLDHALASIDGATWSIERGPGGLPGLVARQEGHPPMSGSFTLRGNRVTGVRVEVASPAAD